MVVAEVAEEVLKAEKWLVQRSFSYEERLSTFLEANNTLDHIADLQAIIQNDDISKKFENINIEFMEMMESFENAQITELEPQRVGGMFDV